jgi:hypothetical protein
VRINVYIFLFVTLLTPDQQNLIKEIPKNIIIAHRGTAIFAPEQTEVEIL